MTLHRIIALLLLTWALLACTPRATTPVTVSELQQHFETEGFTFTELPAEGFEVPLGTRRVGLSPDGFVQVQIYGDDTPNRVALTVSGLPQNNRSEVYMPHMVFVAQRLVPEWGDANQWLTAQLGFGQNQLQNIAREERGDYSVIFSSTRDVLNLMMSLRGDSAF